MAHAYEKILYWPGMFMAIMTHISITASDEWANCGDALRYVIKMRMLLPLFTLATCFVGVLCTISQPCISLCLPSYKTLGRSFFTGLLIVRHGTMVILNKKYVDIYRGIVWAFILIFFT